MALKTAGDAVRAADGAIASYQEQIGLLAEEREAVRAQLAAVERDEEANARDLAAAWLPDAEEETAARADREAGGAGLAETLRRIRAEQDERVARIRAIEQDPRYADRELLAHATTGTLVMARAEAEEALSLVEPEFTRLNKDGDLQSAMRRWGKPEPEGFVRLLRTALLYGFLADHLRRRRDARLVERYGRDVASSIARFERVRDTHSHWTKELESISGQLAAIEALIAEHGELRREVEATRAGALGVLRDQLAAYLARVGDFTELRSRAGAELRTLLTTGIVLREKQRYLTSLVGWLGREIASREATANKIRAVRGKWRVNPGKPLRTGDKTKWLITLPENKRHATKRQITQARTMRSGIYDFDDYLLYDRILDSAEDVLAYDVFARYSDERMPGDGFVFQALPDVELYRESYGPPAFGAIDAAGMDGFAGGGGGAGGEWDEAAAALAAGATSPGLEAGELAEFFGADAAEAQEPDEEGEFEDES